MANIAAYSRHKMLAELNDPLFTNNGDGGVPLVYSPDEQKAKFRQNAGLEVTTGVAIFVQPVPATQNTTATLTAAQVLTGLILSNPAAGQTLTFPLGTGLDAAIIPTMSVGYSFDVTVANLSANALTMAANTDITNGGSAEDLTIAANASATYRFRKTGAGAFTFYRVV